MTPASTVNVDRPLLAEGIDAGDEECERAAGAEAGSTAAAAALSMARDRDSCLTAKGRTHAGDARAGRARSSDVLAREGPDIACVESRSCLRDGSRKAAQAQRCSILRGENCLLQGGEGRLLGEDGHEQSTCTLIAFMWLVLIGQRSKNFARAEAVLGISGTRNPVLSVACHRLPVLLFRHLTPASTMHCTQTHEQYARMYERF